MTNETIELDPIEFIPERVALGLDELGIRVMKSEWGDAEHELFLVKQERGEIPADRHPPNRTVTIQLKAEEDDEHEVSLAEAEQKLQKKVGIIQEEGGWVKRVLDVKGKFSTDVGMIVHTAVLGGIHGWQHAHRSIAPEITLTLTVGPYCYGTKEMESAEFKAAEVRQLEIEMVEILGTAPGIFRIKIKNEGVVNWLGFISSLESRDHDAAVTAKMTYEAEELTLLGNAAKTSRAGASGAGNNVVKSGKLTGNWQAILSSRNPVTGEHMSHVGPRRVMFRVWDPNGSAGTIRLRLEWRVLGSTRWIANDEEETFVVNNFSLIDFGEVRPERATVGGQRWEFRVVGKTSTGEELEVQLDQIHIMSTEQYLIVSEEIEAITGGATLWEDHFEQASGAATGKKAPVGGTYEGFGTAADLKVNEAEKLLESG